MSSQQKKVHKFVSFIYQIPVTNANVTEIFSLWCQHRYNLKSFIILYINWHSITYLMSRFSQMRYINLLIKCLFKVLTSQIIMSLKTFSCMSHILHLICFSIYALITLKMPIGKTLYFIIVTFFDCLLLLFLFSIINILLLIIFIVSIIPVI